MRKCLFLGWLKMAGWDLPLIWNSILCSWKWASFRGAIIRDSLFYHGCNAKDAKLGSKMSRRLVVPISLGLATVTFAGCIGISIAGCIGIAAITITITGTLTACKLWKIVAMTELRIIPCSAVKNDLRHLRATQGRKPSRQDGGLCSLRRNYVCAKSHNLYEWAIDWFMSRALWIVLFWASIALSRNSSDD